jgi:hypothetical protein
MVMELGVDRRVVEGGKAFSPTSSSREKGRRIRT